MRRAVLRILLATALAVGLMVAIGNAEAHASPHVPATLEHATAGDSVAILLHTPNSYGNWACGATRLNSYDVVLHAVIVEYRPEYIAAYCRAGPYDTQWYGYLWWNGATSHTSWLFCYLGEYCPPEP
jgi:hypothetical protein